MLRRLTHVVRAFANADNAIETLEALGAVCQPGVSVFAIARPYEGKSFIFHSGVSATFQADLNEELLRRGPSLMSRVAAGSPPPFTFAETMRRFQPSGAERWIFDLFRDHGAKDGLCCVHLPYVVIYVSDKLLTPAALSHEARLALDAGGAMAINRVREHTKQAERPELSPREQTVLLYLSDGLSAAEIADRLSLGEPSVRTFIRRAERKLDAKSQLHAVSIALRQKLI
jgi:DNA-binding CsgD family transcriptional regulator